ncbi:sulfatase-like hydrolase/transferase [Bacteroidota bacterium]
MAVRFLILFIILVSYSCNPKNSPVAEEQSGNYEKLASLELPQRPNILWITYEDQMSTLGCFGDPIALTPNIDKLADEGVRFTNVYSCAGVCAPSRSGLITGMYPTSIGTHHMRTLGNPEYQPVPKYSAVIPEFVKCYSEYLRMGGYYCSNNSKEDYQFIAPVTAWDESSRKAHWKNRPKNKPFFAIFNFTVCHESGMWRNKEHPLRVNPDDVEVPPYYPDNEIVRNEIARNYSNVWEMDSLAGIVVKELEEEGLLESTIIFVYSDHGGPLPRQKREIYDTGMKVPMVIRFPDQQMAGEVVDELISFIDFAPTLLSLTHLNIPNHLQGQAFLGVKQASPRKYVYAARDRLDDEYDMVRAVRDKQFKYFKNYQPEKPYIMDIEYRMQMTLMQELLRAFEADELNRNQLLWFSQKKPIEELYDLENDPHELHNLIDEPSYREKLEELRQAHIDWQKNYGDLGFIPEEEMLREMWKGKDYAPSTEYPVLNRNEGTLSISCTTNGASIGFKIIREGTEPASWDVYTEPIEVNPGDIVKVIAHRIGYEPSQIIELKI